MFAILFSSPNVLLLTKDFTIYIFFYRHAVFGKTKTLNSKVENTKVQNSNVWKNQNSQFLCLEKTNH